MLGRQNPVTVEQSSGANVGSAGGRVGESDQADVVRTEYRSVDYGLLCLTKRFTDRGRIFRTGASRNEGDDYSTDSGCFGAIPQPSRLAIEPQVLCLC
jgi:hypothetical protein